MIDARKRTDAPATYRTPQRPGQSGEQNASRPGPSPLSRNASGPHPAYEPHDSEGLAAGKHVRETKDAASQAPAVEASDRSDFVVMENGRRIGVLKQDAPLRGTKPSSRA